MGKVKALITNNQTKVRIPTGIRLLMRRCCHAVLTHEGFSEDAEVSISFVDNDRIRELNNTYRDMDKATDVLSFPLGEQGNYDINNETGALLLGDIVISLETAVKQAAVFGHSLEREIGFLTVHSMLHLLGYDHEAGLLEERIMREKEEAVLTELGIARDISFVNDNESEN
ncbi:MAG: rRNA maturation RNase YbeY [Oscillospiraceae bacterium]